MGVGLEHDDLVVAQNYFSSTTFDSLYNRLFTIPGGTKRVKIDQVFDIPQEGIDRLLICNYPAQTLFRLFALQVMEEVISTQPNLNPKLTSIVIVNDKTLLLFVAGVIVNSVGYSRYNNIEANGGSIYLAGANNAGKIINQAEHRKNICGGKVRVVCIYDCPNDLEDVTVAGLSMASQVATEYNTGKHSQSRFVNMSTFRDIIFADPDGISEKKVEKIFDLEYFNGRFFPIEIVPMGSNLKYINFQIVSPFQHNSDFEIINNACRGSSIQDQISEVLVHENEFNHFAKCVPIQLVLTTKDRTNFSGGKIKINYAYDKAIQW